MPTRSDFYRQHPSELIWLGSAGCDGDPHSILREMKVLQGNGIFPISSEDDWVESVDAVLADHEEATHPDWGWPWPWNTSAGTDYAYTWDPHAGILVSHYGKPWLTVSEVLTGYADSTGLYPVFPDMSAVKEVRWDAGNAPMVISNDGTLSNPPLQARNAPKPAGA